MDLKMYFLSWWTLVIYFYKLMDLWCILLLLDYESFWRLGHGALIWFLGPQSVTVAFVLSSLVVHVPAASDHVPTAADHVPPAFGTMLSVILIPLLGWSSRNMATFHVPVCWDTVGGCQFRHLVGTNLSSLMERSIWEREVHLYIWESLNHWHGGRVVLDIAVMHFEQ